MRRLELALALDNTGSMLDSGKLDALKTATNSLLDTLEKASKKKDDIKVSIIPFTTFVNVDPEEQEREVDRLRGMERGREHRPRSGLINGLGQSEERERSGPAA